MEADSKRTVRPPTGTGGHCARWTACPCVSMPSYRRRLGSRRYDDANRGATDPLARMAWNDLTLSGFVRRSGGQAVSQCQAGLSLGDQAYDGPPGSGAPFLLCAEDARSTRPEIGSGAMANTGAGECSPLLATRLARGRRVAGSRSSWSTIGSLVTGSGEQFLWWGDMPTVMVLP